MPARIVCFGELLLRLGAPDRQLLLQAPHLDVHVGGAEANVAVALAHYGHDARMVGAVADNALGAAALGELRRHGVDVAGVRRAAGRMGLYFLTQGALHRPSEVLYDRAGSAFAQQTGDALDWPALLAGADWLHLSGITPALGANAAAAALAAVRTAVAAGVRVSFDGNYRPALWAGSEATAAPLLRELIAHAEVLFASDRDMQVVLGNGYAQADAADRFAAAAADAFAAFPRLRRMAATLRVAHSVERQDLAAIHAQAGGGVFVADSYSLSGIVDRIGTGDAFAAGVLHGELAGLGAADGLCFGLAAACLKHSIPGDFAPLSARQVQALVDDDSLDVRR
ncbi:sugar kinase [Lysobacter sp. CA199]|uniref:sugar kinase n=1 Tax=Lysobacter sp. CA199 TaxID=3455608 RepID=UPI003F8D1352